MNRAVFLNALPYLSPAEVPPIASRSSSNMSEESFVCFSGSVASVEPNTSLGESTGPAFFTCDSDNGEQQDDDNNDFDPAMCSFEATVVVQRAGERSTKTSTTPLKTVPRDNSSYSTSAMSTSQSPAKGTAEEAGGATPLMGNFKQKKQLFFRFGKSGSFKVDTNCLLETRFISSTTSKETEKQEKSLPASAIFAFKSCCFRIFWAQSSHSDNRSTEEAKIMELKTSLNKIESIFSEEETQEVSASSPMSMNQTESHDSTTPNTESTNPSSNEPGQAEARDLVAMRESPVREQEDGVEKQNTSALSHDQSATQERSRQVRRWKRKRDEMERSWAALQSLDTVLQTYPNQRFDDKLLNNDDVNEGDGSNDVAGRLMLAAAKSMATSFSGNHTRSSSLGSRILGEWNTEIQDIQLEIEEAVNSVFPPPRQRKGSGLSAPAAPLSPMLPAAQREPTACNEILEKTEMLLQRRKQALRERHMLALFPST